MPTPDKPLRRSPATNALVVLGIAIAFAVLAGLIWAYWSANDDNPRLYNEGAVVESAQVPPPGPVGETAPVTRADPTGDAVARDVERAD